MIKIDPGSSQAPRFDEYDQKCRWWRGRCLAAVAHRTGTESGAVEFTDGSRYQVSPVYDLDWDKLADDNDMPGCWFNKVIKRRARYRANKIADWPFPQSPEYTEKRWLPPGPLARTEPAKPA